MTAASRKSPILRSVAVSTAVAALILCALVWRYPAMLDRIAQTRVNLRAPDFTLLAGQSPAILVHLAAAMSALLIGLVIMTNPKGRTLHRTLGWIWAALMGTTAVSSIFIRVINHGHFSLIHLLTGWVIFILPVAVYAARNHKVSLHRRAMTGLFVGGLLVAGAFTFFPGRLMWRIFFG